MAKVIIVAGGHAGCELAKALTAAADIVLIDPKDHFVHTPALIRGIADPATAAEAIMPYGDFPKAGKRIKGRATRINGNTVTLENGETVTGDFIVVATGSTYASPFKADTVDTLRQNLERAQTGLRQARTVAIVGAGAVGTELAGEIAFAYPDINLHLITRNDSLFPMYKPALGSDLMKKLRGMGVSIHLSSKVEDLPSANGPFTGPVTIDAKLTIDADLVFPVIGARSDNALLLSLPGVTQDVSGQVVLDDYLRPSSDHPNIYALGDSANTGDAMTIVGITRQFPWLAKHLKTRIAGKSGLGRAYAPWPLAPILLPLGPKTGSSLLPIGKTGLVAGSWVTSWIKGKDLFLPKYRKLLS